MIGQRNAGRTVNTNDVVGLMLDFDVGNGEAQLAVVRFDISGL